MGRLSAINSKGTSHFYYLKTGGGHLAPAKAVANHLAKQMPDRPAPTLIDGLENAPPSLRRLVEDGYRTAQNRCAWFYEFLYAFNKIPPMATLTARIVSEGVKEALREQLTREEPETIVIFHFLLIRPIMELLHEHKIKSRVVVVVTDPYSAHPL